jgi:hypothetical protein
MAVGIKVLQTGPLFDRPTKITRDATRLFVQRMVELGEQRLKIILNPRPKGVFLSVSEAAEGKASKGNYSGNVESFVDNLQGLITDGGVIYGSWLEGTSSRNVTTRFKGYASFRKTEQWLQKKVDTEAKNFVHQYVRRMNGI